MRKILQCDLSTQHTQHSRNLIISIRVLQAKFQTFQSTQSSYTFKLTYGKVEFTSTPSKSFKGHPKWKETHTFESEKNQTLVLTVYQKRVFLKNKLIGFLSIQNLFFNKNSTVRWRNLNDEEGAIGQILIGILCEDDQGGVQTIKINELEVQSLTVKFQQIQVKKGISRLNAEKKKLRGKMRKMVKAVVETIQEEGESVELAGMRKERIKVWKEIKEVLMEIKRVCRDEYRRMSTDDGMGKEFLLGEIQRVKREIQRVRSMTLLISGSVQQVK